MNKPKVTVIVPVYNVASYIEKCATSLFEQTLANLEILFVDDCGSDNSVEIIENTLKKFPSRNSLTRIIRMPSNTGQAGVRRQGIIEATGQYVIQCDGDDWIDLNLYECLYNKAIETDADVVGCGFIYEDLHSQTVHENEFRYSDGKSLIRSWYKETYHMSTCNKLVRRSLYTDNGILPWVGLNMWEDNGLFTRVFYYANRIAYVNNCFYHYNRCNMSAMTSGYGIKQVEQMVGIANHLTEFFASKTDAKEFEKTVMAFQYLARINFVTDSFANLRRYNETFKGSEAIVSELDPKAFSSKGRFRFYMVKYHLAWLFVLMFKVKKIIG